MNQPLLFIIALLTGLLPLATSSPAQTLPSTTPARRVEVIKSAHGWQLLRAGQPYFIKGAGGGASKPLLAQLGGNSFRTWGVGNDIPAQLDEAEKLGLSVTLGIWLGHENDGFSYANPKQVADQLQTARAAIQQYKDHPALLIWAIGNEMEGYQAGDNPAVWKAVDDIAAAAKQLDPNHPTMTVIAEVGGQRVQSIHRLCPHIDIVGINSYGGAPSIGERYRKAGGVKPYILTEFGPPGIWECPKTSWGVPIELSSTEKGAVYRNAYQHAVTAQPDLCLGSYIFTWGHKQEATATWYGLFLPDNSQLEAVHVISELWTGRAPANRCPQIESPRVDHDQVSPGQTIHATLHVTDPDADPLKIQWILRGEVKKHSIGGAHEQAPDEYNEAFTSTTDQSATLKMPATPGTYRLFAYARDNHGNAAVANTVLRVLDH